MQDKWVQGNIWKLILPKGWKFSQNRNTLIEQSVEAQTILIEHSLGNPFENSWHAPVLEYFCFAFLAQRSLMH